MDPAVQYLFLVDDEKKGNEKLRKTMIENLNENQMRQIMKASNLLLNRQTWGFIPPKIQHQLQEERKFIKSLVASDGDVEKARRAFGQIGGNIFKFLLRDVEKEVKKKLKESS